MNKVFVITGNQGVGKNWLAERMFKNPKTLSIREKQIEEILFQDDYDCLIFEDCTKFKLDMARFKFLSTMRSIHTPGCPVTVPTPPMIFIFQSEFPIHERRRTGVTYIHIL